MSEPLKFTCTTRGAVAGGRHRLRSALLVLGLVGLAVAIVTAVLGRVVPALMAAAAGLLTFYARRMSADLDTVWLEVDGSSLIVQMLRQRQVLEHTGRARALEPAEIDHLTSLATTAGITAGSGGFESHQLGEIDLYATDLDRAVLVDLGETATVVTPDDPGGFIAAIEAAGMPAPTPPPGPLGC